MHARDSGYSQSIIHLVERFLSLVRDGVDFEDTNWSFEFWSLYTIEYYLFSNDMIPRFIFRLWMKDLASFYAQSGACWESHRSYLDDFQLDYEDMRQFFGRIKYIAATFRDDSVLRSREVESFVSTWKGSADMVTK